MNTIGKHSEGPHYRKTNKAHPMKKKIAVLPGDGAGPEIIDQAIKVLDAIGDRFQHQFEYCYADAGATASRLYGVFFPETTISTCLQANAILAGPLSVEKTTYSSYEFEGFNSVIGQFVQYLPLRYYTSTYHLSMLKNNQSQNAEHLILNGYDAHLEDTKNIDRFCRYIFNVAARRKKTVLFVQTGSLKKRVGKWRESIERTAKLQPGIQCTFAEAEKVAQQLVYNQLNGDVIITLDETGQLLYSLANKLYGTAGLLPKILVGSRQSIFQAAQEDQAEQAGEDTANPFAMLYAAALLLSHLQLHQEAQLVENVVQHILDKGIGTADLFPSFVYNCSQIGDIAAQLISEGNPYGLKRERIRARMSTII